MRYFIYVNTNSDKKHITVHCENEESCSDIMKQVTSKKSCHIISAVNTSKDIIKIAETNNGFWLLVHGECPDENNIDNILEIIKNTENSISFTKDDIKFHC